MTDLALAQWPEERRFLMGFAQNQIMGEFGSSDVIA